MTDTAPDAGAPSLAIRLFGPFEVFVNGRPLPRLRSRKGQWLLALLALRSGSPVDRTFLAGTLWPDSDGPQALGSLRTCLTDLRAALGAEADRLRAPTPQTLSLDLAGAVDKAAYDGSVAAVRAALGEDAFTAAWTEGRAMTLEDAVRDALAEAGEGSGHPA